MSCPIAQYTAWSRDHIVRKQSTSGGVFTELARTIFSRGGIVLSAGFMQSPFRLVHKIARNETELSDMRGAKYAPSDMSIAWHEVKNAVEERKPCLFVGTPCQTAAMRRRFGNGGGCLILCALFCHSIPESYVWKKYIAELEALNRSKLKTVKFRSKEHGGSWRKGMFVAEFEDGLNSVVQPLAGNVYADAFFMRLSTRASCLKCPFKNGKSGADIMIGDFWGIEISHPELDDGEGLNAVLVYTHPGEALLAESKCELRKVEYSEITARNRHLERCIECDTRSRARFLQLCKTMTIEEALRKIRSRPLWKRAVSWIYNILKGCMS